MDAASQAAVDLRPMLPTARIGYSAYWRRPLRGWVLRQRDDAGSAGNGRRRHHRVRRAVERLPGRRRR
jgi:hypothetical protein